MVRRLPRFVSFVVLSSLPALARSQSVQDDAWAPELTPVSLSEARAVEVPEIGAERVAPGAPSSASKPSGVSLIRVPVGETEGVDNALLAVGGLAGVTQKRVIAQEWDVERNAPMAGGVKLTAAPQGAYRGSEESEDRPNGNFILGIIGNGMGSNRGVAPIWFEAGANASQGYLIVSGAVAYLAKGFGGGFLVSPLAGVDYPLKLVVGYRYYRTSGGGYANDNHDPYEIREFKGPAFGIMSSLNRTVDLRVEGVWARGKTTVYDYSTDKQIGDPTASKSWRFTGGVIFNIGVND